jgi:hypothetical protein
MEDQISLYPRAPEKSCESCAYYSALRMPRERSDGAAIYGYCFKNGDTNHSTDMGKGCAVFIDGGCCEKYRRRKN